uniref:Uncharacterized protein n=1 Tax=Cucumis sativus TaxID=3659 RepID=A0A0A0KXP3_CUCSA
MQQTLKDYKQGCAHRVKEREERTLATIQVKKENLVQKLSSQVRKVASRRRSYLRLLPKKLRRIKQPSKKERRKGEKRMLRQRQNKELHKKEKVRTFKI